ncbi:hypothetical protein, partial [Thiolapillus sp.]|uniref:hypothetical protein n=1 Tax=Thiolapillus sp. TaxID=2017437 RepID=UPI003AF72251
FAKHLAKQVQLLCFLILAVIIHGISDPHGNLRAVYSIQAGRANSAERWGQSVGLNNQPIAIKLTSSPP